MPWGHLKLGIERHQSLVSPTHPLYGKGMYRARLGPNHYSFTRGGVHFVGLDTVDIADLWYYGHVDEAQLAWLEGELASGDKTIIFFHHPIYGDNISSGWSIVGDSFLVESNDRIYDILEENSATIRKIFFGHGHLFGSDTLHGTIGLHETGSTGDFLGNPSNMTIVSFDDAGERFETIRNR